MNKTYIILHGTDLYFIEAITKLAAMNQAVKMLGPNADMLVREITDVIGAAQLKKFL